MRGVRHRSHKDVASAGRRDRRAAHGNAVGNGYREARERQRRGTISANPTSEQRPWMHAGCVGPVSHLRRSES